MNRLISPLLLILLFCIFPRMVLSIDNLCEIESTATESISLMQKDYGAILQNSSPVGDSLQQPSNTTTFLPADIWLKIWEQLDDTEKLHLGTLSKIFSFTLLPRIHLYFADLRLQLLFENKEYEYKSSSKKFHDLVAITKIAYNISQNPHTSEYTLQSTTILRTYENQAKHFLEKYVDSFGENIEMYWVLKQTDDYNFLCKIYNFSRQKEDPLELVGLTALCCIRYSFIGIGTLCMAPYFLACSPIMGVCYLCVLCNDPPENSYDETVETI